MDALGRAHRQPGKAPLAARAVAKRVAHASNLTDGFDAGGEAHFRDVLAVLVRKVFDVFDALRHFQHNHDCRRFQKRERKRPLVVQ